MTIAIQTSPFPAGALPPFTVARLLLFFRPLRTLWPGFRSCFRHRLPRNKNNLPGANTILNRT